MTPLPYAEQPIPQTENRDPTVTRVANTRNPTDEITNAFIDTASGKITVKLSWFDLHHQLLGELIVDAETGHITVPGSFDGASYVAFGNGTTTLITTSIQDLVAMHQSGISDRIITPYRPDQLLGLCQALSGINSRSSYHILGTKDHKHATQVAKKALECGSSYPRYPHDTWADFINTEGSQAVRDFLDEGDMEAIAVARFMVTAKHVESIQATKSHFDNLIINQHILVICAAPNAGKTTIMNWVCSQISETTGIRYINLDCSGADLRRYQEYATDNGFELINFDITATSVVDFFTSLEETSDLTDKIYVIDTLKKVVDPMKKSEVSKLMKLLRRLANKGATFVLLAHTNKHASKDGLPVFEGVGDVKSDCDDMVYLIPDKHPDGSMTVTTHVEKSRGAINPLTFHITPDMGVSLTEYVDVLPSLRRKADEPIIQQILQALQSGLCIQKDIVEFCIQAGHPKNKAHKVLENWSAGTSPLWSRTKGPNNSWIYQGV